MSSVVVDVGGLARAKIRECAQRDEDAYLGVEGVAPNDIDIMVIGTPDVGEVYEICTCVEAAIHRPVNSTILTTNELADQSGFIGSVRAGPVVPLVGELPWR